MKGHSTTIQGSPIFLDYPDYTDQRITVNGREWRFDFDKRFGPLWLKKDGEPRVCQYPNKAVWTEFEKWQKKNATYENRRKKHRSDNG